MVYGYARISRKQQSIERQIRNITAEYPKAKIYQEAFTGTTNNRPEWNKLIKKAAKGDAIVFDSVSRMSRNAAEGFADYERLRTKGITLIFLKEPHINTDVYAAALNSGIALTGNDIADIYIQATNKVLSLLAEKQIKIAFEQAEKEVTDLHERTAEGIKTAKLNGKQIGRTTGATITTKKSISAKETILKHSKDFGGTLSDADCIKLIGITRNTYYKYKKELKSE